MVAIKRHLFSPVPSRVLFRRHPPLAVMSMPSYLIGFSSKGKGSSEEEEKWKNRVRGSKWRTFPIRLCYRRSKQTKYYKKCTSVTPPQSYSVASFFFANRSPLGTYKYY